MTQPEQRLEEIESRLRSPYTHENTRVHMTADIMYLLAELRKAQGKLARVEQVVANIEYIVATDLEAGTPLRGAASQLRAAVADATGGGE